MTERLKVPEHLIGKFNRLIYSIPAEFRSQEDVRRTLLMYLRLGGLNMAQLRIRIARGRFPNGPIFSKRSGQRQADKYLDMEDDAGLADEDGISPNADELEPADPASDGRDSGQPDKTPIPPDFFVF